MVDIVNLEEKEAAMIKAAIQASLRDVDPPNGESSKSNEKVIDLTNESDEDPDVKIIYPKSKSVVESESEDEGEQEPVENIEVRTQLPTEASAPQGILGLDRKQMELERLARQNARQNARPSDEQEIKSEHSTRQAIRDGKRKAGSSSLVSQLPVKKSRREATSNPATYVSIPTRNQAGSSVPLPTPNPVPNPVPKQAPSSSVAPTRLPTLQWQRGIVKKTYLDSAERSSNDITFDELLQPSGLKLAVISSFMWDMDWIFDKIQKETKILLVMSVKNPDARRQYLSETSGMPNVKLCFPPMEGQINCMHSKLILLFHSEYLRIAVPTANATSHDWGVRGLMENTVFIIDLPKLAQNPKLNSKFSETPFWIELEYFLRASTISDLVIERMKGYDFSETSRYQFVHSIGGIHTGDALKRTGFCGLGRAVSRIGMRSLSSINVQYVASSIGALKPEFIRRIYLACMGNDGLPETSTPKADEESDYKKTHAAMGDTEKTHMQIYFPSHQTVTEAHHNPTHTAGTIILDNRFWQSDQFPREMMRDCISERGTLMHNKLIYAWPDEPVTLPNGDECKGWAYVGSHNISESAWGFRLTKDRVTGKQKINIRNYECGVLVPIVNESPSEEKRKARAALEAVLFSINSSNRIREIFNDTVPVPMLVPAPPLTTKHKPWFFIQESMKTG